MGQLRKVQLRIELLKGNLRKECKRRTPEVSPPSSKAKPRAPEVEPPSSKAKARAYEFRSMASASEMAYYDSAYES